MSGELALLLTTCHNTLGLLLVWGQNSDRRGEEWAVEESGAEVLVAVAQAASANETTTIMMMMMMIALAG